MKKYSLILALSLTGLTLTHAQNRSDSFAGDESDPFAAVDDMDSAPTSPQSDNPFGTEKTQAQKSLSMISLCFETFSLPLHIAAAHQRERLSDALLYQRLLEGLTTGSVTQESFDIIRTRSAELANTGGFLEYIYPTEFEPPQLPQQLGLAITTPVTKENPQPVIDEEKLARLSSAPMPSQISHVATPATPVSFETRNTGLEISAEASMGDHPFLHIRLSAFEAFLTGHSEWGQNESLAKLPEFESRTLNLGITAIPDKPSLVGTFNRPSHSKIDTDSEVKVWFAFVTPSIVTIKP